MMVFGFHQGSHRDLFPRMQQINDRMTILPDIAWSNPQIVIDAILGRMATG